MLIHKCAYIQPGSKSANVFVDGMCLKALGAYTWISLVLTRCDWLMSPELVSRLKGYNCFSEDITERCNPYFFVIRAFASPAIVCILRAIVLHYRPKVIPQYAVHRCSFVKFYIMSTFRTEKENPITLEDHVEYFEKRHGVKYKDYLRSQRVFHKKNILVFWEQKDRLRALSAKDTATNRTCWALKGCDVWNADRCHHAPCDQW